MNEAAPGPVQPLREELLDAVVNLHMRNMGYTFNSRLGSDHLRFLYRAMASDPACFVGVTTKSDRPTGAVSGCIDVGDFTSRLVFHMPLRRLVRTAARILVQPRLLIAWFQTARVAAALGTETGDPPSVLTAIVVDEGSRGMGVGRTLVQAFEHYLKSKNLTAYRLDTLASNAAAMQFYRSMGFVEAARRAGSVVLVRSLR